MKERLTILLATLLLSIGVHAHIVFHDTFEADLRDTNPNTNVNLDSLLRQQNGSVTTLYTETNAEGGDALLQFIAGGTFANQSVLRLSTRSTGGRASSSAGIKSNTNFANALAGKKYEISFRAAIELAGTPSEDVWGSFYITDGPAVTPNAPTTRYAFLFRERGRHNLVFYSDGAMIRASSVTDNGTSYFARSRMFTFNIIVDEPNRVVDTVLNQGLSNELILPQQPIEMDNSRNRYFGFRTNQVNATGLTDLLIDDFKIREILNDDGEYVDIPETSSYPMVCGLLALAFAAVRRHR